MTANLRRVRHNFHYLNLDTTINKSQQLQNSSEYNLLCQNTHIQRLTLPTIRNFRRTQLFKNAMKLKISELALNVYLRELKRN
jgi:hypothetical protein